MEPITHAATTPTPDAKVAEPIEPIMLVEAMDTHGRVHAQLHLKGAGAACKIGRGLTCDLVLDDAFAAAEHTQLTLQADGRVTVLDLGSRNGTRINRHRQSDKLEPLASVAIEDALLIIGRTRLRVRTLHSPLAAEKEFRRDALQRHRTLLAVGGSSLVLTLASINEWLQAPEQLSERILVAILGVIVALSVWVGVWALVTRIGHGLWNLRLHGAIACNATALSAVLGAAASASAFALQLPLLDTLGLLLGIAIVLSALYLHLRAATHLTARTAALAAYVLPLLLGGAVTWISEQENTRDVNRVAVGSDVYPPTLLVAHGQDLDSYLAGVAKLKRSAGIHRQHSLQETPLADAGELTGPTPAAP